MTCVDVDVCVCACVRVCAPPEDLLRDEVAEASAELRAEIKTLLTGLAGQAAKANDELWPADATGGVQEVSRLTTVEEIVSTLSSQVVTLEEGLKNATAITTPDCGACATLATHHSYMYQHPCQHSHRCVMYPRIVCRRKDG